MLVIKPTPTLHIEPVVSVMGGAGFHVYFAKDVACSSGHIVEHKKIVYVLNGGWRMVKFRTF